MTIRQSKDGTAIVDTDYYWQPMETCPSHRSRPQHQGEHMSKEAMKLALEQRITDYLSAGGLFNPELADHVAVRDLLIDCRKALAEQPAQQALDKKAENARELGLDYEPVWNNLPSNKDVEDAMRLKRLSRLAEQPAQQEPVAWVCYGSNNKLDIDFFEDEIADLAVGTNLYTSPPAQRKPLTDDEIHQCFLASEQGQDGTEFRKAFARAIEAKLKEKNT